jgi:hypothetical protein
MSLVAEDCTEDHKSKLNALEEALNSVVKGGVKTRLGVKPAPSLTDLEHHDEKTGVKKKFVVPYSPKITDHRRRPRLPEHVKNPAKFKKVNCRAQ